MSGLYDPTRGHRAEPERIPGTIQASRQGKPIGGDRSHHELLEAIGEAVMEVCGDAFLELYRLRQENAEVPRLRKENAELKRRIRNLGLPA